MISNEQAEALTLDEVELAILTLGGLGGTVSATELGEHFGGYSFDATSGSLWTSVRLYQRLRELLGELRALQRVGRVGSKKFSRYALLTNCVCGHPRVEHAHDPLSDGHIGECLVVVASPVKFCDCSRFVGQLPEPQANLNSDAPEELMSLVTTNERLEEVCARGPWASRPSRFDGHGFWTLSVEELRALYAAIPAGRSAMLTAIHVSYLSDGKASRALALLRNAGLVRYDVADRCWRQHASPVAVLR